MTIDNEKTAFTSGKATFVDSKQDRLENKTSISLPERESKIVDLRFGKRNRR